MSAVSSESPLAASDLSAPSAHLSSESQHGESAEPGSAPASADFGPNEWLVDELYERYLTDPGSVDKAWWSFFADYRPVRGVNGTGPQPVWTEAPTPPPAQAAATTPATTPTTAPAQAPARPPAQASGQAPAAPAPVDADVNKLRGAAARTAQNMAASLSVPTATSVRAVPAKLLIDNRIVINNHLQRGR